MPGILARLALALSGSGGLWLVDVSEVVKSFGGAKLCNGLFCLEVDLGFHIGLYLALASILTALVLSLWEHYAHKA